MWSSSTTWSETLKGLATTSLMTLGEEEVVAIDESQSIAHSAMIQSVRTSWNRKTVGVQQQQQQQQQERQQGTLSDSISVLTYDPHLHTHQNVEEQLQQKEDELCELQQLHHAQSERLDATQISLTESQLQCKHQQREWKLTLEDLQSQKIVLQERLDVMEDDLHNDELMQHMGRLISEEAPVELLQSASQSSKSILAPSQQKQKQKQNKLELYLSGGSQHSNGSDKHGDNNTIAENNDDEHDDEDEDDTKSVTSRASTTSTSTFRLTFGRNRLGQNSNNNNNQKELEAQRKKLVIYEEYITKLQAKLVESMHAMTVFTNQIQTMTDAQEEQLIKMRLELQVSERERAHMEMTLAKDLDICQQDKRLAEQQLLAKLEIRTDRVQRLEELVEELRDMAHQGALSEQTFDGTLALENVKLQFDILSKEKYQMVQQHYEQTESKQREVKRLTKVNAKLERQIQRLQSGDELTSLEQFTTSMDRNTTSDDRADDDAGDDTGDAGDNYMIRSINNTTDLIGDVAPATMPDRLEALQDEPKSSARGKSPHSNNSKRSLRRNSGSHSSNSHSTSSHYKSDKLNAGSHHSSIHSFSSSHHHHSLRSKDNNSIPATTATETEGSTIAMTTVASPRSHHAAKSTHRPSSISSSGTSSTTGSGTKNRNHTFKTTYSTSDDEMMIDDDEGDGGSDDDDAKSHASVKSYDLLNDDDKKLHVEQHRPVQSKEFRRLSMQIQETKWSQMDKQSREKSQAVVNRYL